RVFKRCAPRNSVFLVDEADVFLKARSKDHLDRNELVGLSCFPRLTSSLVFLRLLEYYTGVLILTTNRISVIDAAFESRIDI
ncbi:uncharacterized protein K441DRAFT_507177, partial [Cenococcum geophilum 1.58]